MSKHLGASRRRLHARHPFCHWCGGGPLVLEERPRRHGWRKRLATVDHLRSKLDPTRLTPIHVEPSRRLVLACFDCNHRRGREEYATLSIEERRRRSGRWPRAAAGGQG